MIYKVTSLQALLRKAFRSPGVLVLGNLFLRLLRNFRLILIYFITIKTGLIGFAPKIHYFAPKINIFSYSFLLKISYFENFLIGTLII